MPIILPENRDEVLQNLQTDFVANIPESDPFLQESWILGFLIAIAYREFDIYTQVRQLLLQIFPTTAEGIFARQWGNLKGVDKNPATSSTGFITATGVDATEIPEGTLWSSIDDKQYTAINQDYIITAGAISVTSLISSGGIAEAVTANEHFFGSGMSVTIVGADQSEYNGTFIVTVTDVDKFKYEITGSPASPATGAVVAEAIFASILVQAQDTGNETNITSGGQLTLVNPIAGVDDTSYVQFTEIGGGSDEETDDQYRLRYLERYQSPVAHFNEAEIINTAKEVPGVTDVYVFGLVPDIGDVTVFFMRYNDPDPIPDLQEVNDVKAKLATITPAHTPTIGSGGLIVKAPIAQIVDFTFTNLSPNTSTMKTAIENSLAEFFRDKLAVGQDLTQIAYQATIFQTVDPATGTFVESFTLSTPAGDISVPFENIAVLGLVTFNT